VEIKRKDVVSENGSFRFVNVPPGTHTLVVQRLGFHPATRTLSVAPGSTQQLDIKLASAVFSLSTMVVTGTLGERSASEVLSPTTVVDGAALARKLGATIAATLQREPGVSSSGMGPATSRTVIRGLSGDRVVMLEDGARPGDMSTTSPDHAVAVDPLTASRFEVVRGPMSLLYGSSALGGVVNVVRDEIPTSIEAHTHGTMTLDASSMNNGVAAGGFATTSRGPLALRGEASLRTGGDMRTPIGALENTGIRSINAALGGSLVRPSGHVGASYRFHSNNYGIPGGFVGAHASGVDIELQRHSIKMEAEHRPRSGIFSTLEANAALTDYHHAELEPGGSVGTSFDQQLGALDLLARHDALGPFTMGALGSRVQLREVKLKGALRTPSTSDWNAALFLVEEWESGVLHLQGGVRYDWSHYMPLDPDAYVEVNGVQIPARPRSFGAFSGSFGALLHASDEIQFGASVSRAFRTPDFNELYSDGPHLAAYSYDVGNPMLGQETGLGVDVFARAASPTVRAELAWFRNAMSGFVYPKNTGETGPQAGRPKFQYVGKDAVLTGAEAVLEWAFAPDFAIEGNVSWVRGALAETPDSIPPIDGEPARAGSGYLPLMPPLNGNAGVRWDNEKWFAGADVKMAAAQERLGDFETATPGYATVNLSGGVRLSAGERLHSITLRVDNVADREYRDHLSRVKSIVPEAGRSISLLYRISF
jgi:iron complex outermembrane receptor protein